MLKIKLTKNFELHEFIESKFYNNEQQEDVWEEFMSNNDELLPNIKKLASELQVLRDYLKKPIHINIAFRPVWWEHMNGRSGNSQHCLCKAADIVVHGMHPSEIADKIEYLIASGKMLDGGLGRYNTFTHYDVRPFRARWSH